MNSSENFDNKKKDILLLVEHPTQGLDNVTLTAENKHSINFAESREKILFKPPL